MEQNGLRSGYTTGTCAAAAAKAAALSFLTGNCPDMVTVSLPGGKTVCLEAKYDAAIQHMTEAEGCSGASHCFACVQKDAGDDPDVTHGVRIYAAVSEISRKQLERLKHSGAGYWLSEYPDSYLSGGTGIGIVTKPGLSCPTGHYAINPVPRQMILLAVEETVRKAAFEGCLFVQIMIPDGVRLAEKTFNPRLGIVSGISVLGTTGIVKPMSEAALVTTIQLDIHMKATDGQKCLLMTPGNYGESFLEKQLGVPLGEAVLCSNFVRDAAVMLAEERIRQVLFVSHIGKLVKVSAGIPNTHSRYGDGRMEELKRLTAEVSGKTDGFEKKNLPELLQAVGTCNTTDEALELLLTYRLAEPVLSLAAQKAKGRMESWAAGTVQFEVVTFSQAHGIVGKTGGADALLETWKEGL